MWQKAEQSHIKTWLIITAHASSEKNKNKISNNEEKNQE